MFVKVEMFDIQKCALPLLFSDFDFFANLQGRFFRFVSLALFIFRHNFGLEQDDIKDHKQHFYLPKSKQTFKVYLPGCVV